MQVTIYAEQHRERNGYQGADLKLPAGRFAVADAFQRAHMPEEGGYYMARFIGWPPFLGIILTRCGAEKLEELNLLAWKTGQMDEEQLAAYEGAVAMRQNEDIDTPVTVRELINILYNLDSYTFHPGLLNDQMLGEMCLMGELLADLGTVSDEVFELLSEEKVGAYLRRSEQGEFTDKGYVLRDAREWRDVYDGEHLPEQLDTHDGLISLRIESAASMVSVNSGCWLELPADRKDMERALASLGERTFDRCVIAEMKTILPLFGYEPAGDLYIDKLNLLAKRMAAFPDSGALAKYMAAVEMDGRHDLDRMLDIAENLDCYDFDREVLSPADYGKYLLEEMGADTADPAFDRFDFSGYGARRLEASGFCCTPYGSVGRNDLPFVQEYTKQQSGMVMQ